MEAVEAVFLIMKLKKYIQKGNRIYLTQEQGALPLLS